MVNQKRLLVGTLFTIYEHFGDFVKCIFTILLQIQNENNILRTSKHRQAKVRRFFGIVCTTASFFNLIWSPENVSKRDAIWAPVAKQ